MLCVALSAGATYMATDVISRIRSDLDARRQEAEATSFADRVDEWDTTWSGADAYVIGAPFVTGEPDTYELVGAGAYVAFPASSELGAPSSHRSPGRGSSNRITDTPGDAAVYWGEPTYWGPWPPRGREIAP